MMIDCSVCVMDFVRANCEKNRNYVLTLATDPSNKRGVVSRYGIRGGTYITPKNGLLLAHGHLETQGWIWTPDDGSGHC